MFMMAWAGLLRIGEATAATRADLILPIDSAPGMNFGLLRIRLPKTRGLAARHQAARLDPQDLLELLTSVYADYPKDKLLWPYSASTLRKRLNALQAALGLATTRAANQTPYDLGSFRPGGATFYLHLFEDTEFVRRRGRWMSVRSMEIYLQEVATATFQQRLSETSKDRIRQLCLHFPRILVQSRWYLKSHIPPAAWPHLWSSPA